MAQPIPVKGPLKGDDAIQAQNLVPVTADWAGSLGPDKGGLPASLWRGTPRALVGALLPELRPSQSPGLRSLIRRLLLSNAVAPAGAPPEGAPGLFGQRVALLIAGGQFEAARSLLDAAPDSKSDEGVARARIELGFLSHDMKNTCGRVGDGVRHFQTVFWQRALIACQAMAGDQAEAALGLDLLREQKAPKDELFDRLVEMLGSGDKKARDRLAGREPGPLHVALMEAAGIVPTLDSLAAATPPVARAWATAEHVGSIEHLAATERAAAYGALPVELLREAYAGADAAAEDGPSSDKMKIEKAMRARAAAYRAARDGGTPAMRAEVLQGLLAEGRRTGGAMVVLELAAPLLADIKPSGEAAPLGGVAARAFLASGDRARANAWWAVADPQGARTLPLLARLARGQTETHGQAEAHGQAESASFDPKLVGDGLGEFTEAPGEDGGKRGGLALGLLDAIGDPIGPEQWAVLAGHGQPVVAELPEAPVWFDLPRAAAGKRLGETVLLAVLTLNEGDRLTTQPARLGAALAALRVVGLEAEARGLALEAAIGGGL